MLLNPKRPCPVCGAIVSNRKAVGKPYRCAACGSELQQAKRQGNIQFWIGVGVAGIAAWALGCRGWAWAGVACLLIVPVGLAAVPLWEWIWPKKLERYEGGRIWG